MQCNVFTRNPLVFVFSRLMPVYLAVLAATAGCGTKEAIPETAPVTGVVLYQGKPVDQAVVTFYPVQGAPGTARTNAEGKFVLTTHRAEDGAVPGNHTVTVQLMPEGGVPGMEAQSTGATPLPVKYANVDSSPLKIEVKAGEPNDVKLELTD